MWEVVFLLGKIRGLWLIGLFGEVTVLLTSLISGLSLAWDAFNRDSFVQSPVPESHLTNTCASQRGPGESEDGSAHLSPITKQSHALLTVGQ